MILIFQGEINVGSFLSVNQILYSNFYLLSQNKLYKAILQTNGDLLVMVKYLFLFFKFLCKFNMVSVYFKVLTHISLYVLSYKILFKII